MIILAILENDLRISTDTMLRVVRQHVQFDMRNTAERRYWQTKCRQLMAGMRDEDGVRMVLNVPAKASVNKVSEYVVISACSNKAELQAIRHRLHSYVAGLEESISKLDARIRMSDAVRRYLAVLK